MKVIKWKENGVTYHYYISEDIDIEFIGLDESFTGVKIVKVYSKEGNLINEYTTTNTEEEELKKFGVVPKEFETLSLGTIEYDYSF